MAKLVFGICILCIAACSGCSADSTASSAPETIQPKLQLSQTTSTRVQITRAADVPNNGLQLPVVSPDGKWVAYLDFHSDRNVQFETLFTGQGSGPMSLHIRSLVPGGPTREVCASGALWPVWSPDSSRLVFVAYDPAGQCRLGLHDLSAGATRYLSIPYKSALTPAVSTTGRQVAFAAPGEQIGSFRLHVLDLATGKVIHTCPTDLDNPRQVWPQWTNDGQIVFVHIEDQQAWLAQWSPGKSYPRRLCELRISPTQLGIFQALAGLPDPLSPDDNRFAYYDTATDRTVLLNLRDGREQLLPVGVRSGCWLDSHRFAAADDQELRLFSVPDAAPALLMHGQWLPRHGANDELILCRPGPHPGLFSLVRMNVITGQ